jgi:hypothetical protein
LGVLEIALKLIGEQNDAAMIYLNGAKGVACGMELVWQPVGCRSHSSALIIGEKDEDASGAYARVPLTSQFARSGQGRCCSKVSKDGILSLSFGISRKCEVAASEFASHCVNDRPKAVIVEVQPPCQRGLFACQSGE